MAKLNAVAIKGTGIAMKNYQSLFYDEKEETELTFVSAWLGGGFENTTKLHATIFKTAMKSQDKG